MELRSNSTLSGRITNPVDIIKLQYAQSAITYNVHILIVLLHLSITHRFF